MATKKQIEEQLRIYISVDDLDEVISNSVCIVIRETFTCWCYGQQEIKPNYYLIQHKITHRTILSELIKQNYKKNCSHLFYEGIQKTSDHFYEICWGS